MPWVRFDDDYPNHRKVKRLTDAAFRLHTSAIFWCNRHLTDGHIPTDELGDVSDVKQPRRHVTQLVDKGLWDQVDGGWQIHDYLEYQPSRAKVQADRKQRAEAGQKGGTRSGQARRTSMSQVADIADYR